MKKLFLLGEVKNKITKHCNELGFKNYVLIGDLEKAVKKAFKVAKSWYYVLSTPSCAS